MAYDLEQRRAAHTFRSLTEVAGAQGPTLRIAGKEFLQFCTNNYLGLANDPAVVDAARAALDRYGMGAGASRLVAGSMELHHRLEEELARFKGVPAALVLSTGFMANLAVLTTFAGPADRIISDKLNHASLLDAARFSGAEHRTFPHRDYARAQTLLQRPLRARRAVEVAPGGSPGLEGSSSGEVTGGGQTFLVTDSVFSMDGDLADLPTLCTAARQHEALVVIDEAHATGVLGERGRGLAEAQGVEAEITLTVGTLSKALGSIGGFICGPQPAIDMLINAGRAFIYTTALPPACSAAALAALQIIQSPDGQARRQRVLALAAHVRQELTQMGFDCGSSATPIIPVLLGSSQTALQAAAFLRERGLWVPAIRPPTVGPNQARLRLSLMATHRAGDIERLIAAFRELRQCPGFGV
ncbi:MAG: 8-amino-7-oxononanoate synthase [Phycisphaerae bacterium]